MDCLSGFFFHSLILFVLFSYFCIACCYSLGFKVSYLVQIYEL